MPLVKSSFPLFCGKVIQRNPMPKKQVVEYTCERCARIWYLDSKLPEPDSKLALSFSRNIMDSETKLQRTEITYECLCDSCTDTVTTLVKSIAPLKPRESRAKKKEEPDTQGKPPVTSPPSVSPDAGPARAAEQVSASLAGASSNASPGAAAAKAPPVAPSNQRPK